MKKILFVVFAFSWVPVFAQKANIPAKNVLIIYSDDQSYNTIHALGNQEIYTPNLDRLVKSGVAFTQAHVMGGHQGAVCLPSRVMLLTGRYLNRIPKDGAIIPDSLVSLAEVLRAKGYTTFHTGKWHSDKASHHRMFSAGENISFLGMHFPGEGGQFHPTVFPFDSSGIYNKSLSMVKDTFSSVLYANSAIRFLTSERAKQSPFYCYVAFTSPHDPRTPPKKYVDMYDPEKVSLPPNFLPEHPFDNGDLKVRDEMLLPHPRIAKDVKKEIALYYGMISEMDAQVGRILDALEKTGLIKNTIIVFAGDNGLAVGQHGLLGKQSLYEHSIKVPMIFSGPGIPTDVRSEAFTYLSDISPTLYDYLGLKQPSIVEAKSLMPIFKNSNATVRNSIYNVYGHWSRSIKTSDGYKLIVYNVNGNKSRQLFNLKNDPWEIHNLAEAKGQSDRITKMWKLLKQQMRETHDDLDIDLPDWGRRPDQKASGS
ncbi:sulfatase-like hydrolase/transferase [Pedobacter frigoris]|uniref:sulfatase-like hydrolase/transferase n=1 Tax=Pedobacter frigoris TaxID=2571272 RepID=UPI00292F593D|nr:sulfatase-like hydrolase/transferase [Pedobacter frigoris]